MDQDNKLVLYYSCFDIINSEIPKDFSYLNPFKDQIYSQLGDLWIQQLGRDLQFLNVKLYKFGLELCCEIWIVLDGNYQFQLFREQFARELDIQKIYVPSNCELQSITNLLQNFFQVALLLPPPPRNTPLKLLPSVRQLPELEPLIVAKESDTTFSQKLFNVLQRVSTPFEALLGSDTVNGLKHYLNRLRDRMINSFQVTSAFVTNTIEIKNLPQNIKVCVIQPAREFYDQALEIMESFGESLTPQAFLVLIQEKMGQLWQERLVQPALYFFNEASEEWKFSKDLGETAFRQGLRGRMARLWQQSVIEGSKNFERHMVPK